MSIPLLSSAKDTSIISIGGSLIVPEEIDWKFVRDFKKCIIGQIAKGKRFVLIVGGGRTARKYITAATQIDRAIPDSDKDWIGIHATRLNAHFLRTIFRDYAYARINTNPHDLEDFYNAKEPLMIAAGWRPGFSTDYDAVLLARYLSISTVVNLSNIDYVYDKDPRKYSDAKKITEMSWGDFRALVGDTWNPGMNTPFDPVASEIAQKANITVSILNGRKTANIEKFFAGKKFAGTIISNPA